VLDAQAPGPALSATGPSAGMVRVSERFVSHGHGDAFEVIVWANEEGRVALATGTDAADGAMVVEETLGGASRSDPGQGRLGMEKRAGAWRFFTMHDGADASDLAAASTCAACHQEAARDGMFRLPPARAAAPQVHSTASSAAITATAPTAVATPAATYDASSAGAAASPSR
jgi:hypothetical protein